MRGPALSTAPTAAEPASAIDGKCLACGEPLAEDQEWCVECGAARTVVRRPPDWRIPVAVVGVVIAVVLVALLIALVSLSLQANRL